MKVRQGFISNSSSSSFLILGSYIDKDLYFELADLKIKNLKVHDGYEEGTVAGFDALPFLEQAKLSDAKNMAKEAILKQVPEKYHSNFEKIYLLYDQCED